MNTNNENLSVIPYVTETQTVLCPFCAEEIQQAAIKCKHCGSQIEPEGMPNRDGLIIENPTEEDKVEYEENPSMFRNHPFYFVFCLALCFVGIGFIMFIYWWVKKKSYKGYVQSEVGKRTKSQSASDLVCAKPGWAYAANGTFDGWIRHSAGIPSF